VRVPQLLRTFINRLMGSDINCCGGLVCWLCYVSQGEEHFPFSLTVVMLRILHVLLKPQDMYIRCGFMC
jgi:hypothetical protein